MKFTIENAALTGILAATAKAVPAKPVQTILSNYLLELSNGLLRVTASDAEIALRALVRPDDTDDSGFLGFVRKAMRWVITLLNKLFKIISRLGK